MIDMFTHNVWLHVGWYNDKDLDNIAWKILIFVQT
jgi:hypothetical protein